MKRLVSNLLRVLVAVVIVAVLSPFLFIAINNNFKNLQRFERVDKVKDQLPEALEMTLEVALANGGGFVYINRERRRATYVFPLSGDKDEKYQALGETQAAAFGMFQQDLLLKTDVKSTAKQQKYLEVRLRTYS